MSRFTEQERAEIYAESRRLLEDKPPPTPPATPPEPPLVPENTDPVQKWREHADAFERQRAAARAKLQAERAAARADWSAWNAYIDARVAAALAERQHEIVELAHSSVEFATAVDRKLAELERLLTKLSATHNELRKHVAREPLDMPSPLVRKERLIN